MLVDLVSTRKNISLSELSEGNNKNTIATLEIVIAEKTHKVKLDFSYFFPSSLPEARLISEFSEPNQQAHISSRGVICLFDSEGLLLNQDDPRGLLNLYLEGLVEQLERRFDKTVSDQILDEFEAYFSQESTDKKPYLVSEPDSTDFNLFLKLGNDHKQYIYKNIEDISVFNNADGIPAGQVINVAHIFLDLIKPSEIRKLIETRTLTCKIAKEFIENSIRRAQKISLTKSLGRRKKTKQYILLSLKRPSGGLIFLLLIFQGDGTSNPYSTPSHQTKLEVTKPIVVTKTRLLSRGGSKFGVTDKKILIVGLGSVGSIVANNLIHVGYTKLTFVDKDLLLPENTFRHLLGRRYWFQNKADALKSYFEESYPYVDIKSVSQDFYQLICQVPTIFKDFDLTIIVTGNPNLELYCNALYHKEKANKSMIIAWNEPLGVGGHSLAMVTPTIKGCYQCLFDPFSEIYSNRASFVAPGQYFGTKTNSCGETYIEYGFPDSARTADLVLELVDLVFSGSLDHNPLISWKGNAAQIIERGFKVSTRFEAIQQNEHDAGASYYRENCKVCNELP